MSELEISEETAREQAEVLRRGAEEGIRLMFHVSSEREWFVFAGAVASLYLTSLAATRFDFITLCFIGNCDNIARFSCFVNGSLNLFDFCRNCGSDERACGVREEREEDKGVCREIEGEIGGVECED